MECKILVLKLSYQNVLISASLVCEDDFIVFHFYIGRLECEFGFR